MIVLFDHQIHGMARPGRAGLGEARQGRAGNDSNLSPDSWLGEAGQGGAWPGRARQGIHIKHVEAIWLNWPFLRHERA